MLWGNDICHITWETKGALGRPEGRRAAGSTGKAKNLRDFSEPSSTESDVHGASRLLKAPIAQWT
jgi:hypothetical protein